MMDTLTRPGDVVAVYVGDEISFFARVEEILPDVKRGWRKLRFLILAVPMREVTWILEPEQIDGKPFTMGGTPLRIERVPPSAPEAADEPEKEVQAKKKKPGVVKVIEFPGKSRK